MATHQFYRAPVATPIKQHGELYIPVVRHDSSPTSSIQNNDVMHIKDNALVSLSELLSVLMATGRTYDDPDIHTLQAAVRTINNL